MTDFHRLLGDVIKCFDNLIILENKKLDAIAAGDIECLDLLMKEEQALTMKLRSFDKKREDMQAGLGFGGMTLQEIIKKCTGSDREKFEQAYETLSDRAAELKEATRCAGKYIELHLETINVMLTRLENEKKQDGGGYDKTGHSNENIEDGSGGRFKPTKA